MWNSLTGLWHLLDGWKRDAAKRFPEGSEQRSAVKDEIDDLFRQASGGRFKICPAWFIGGF